MRRVPNSKPGERPTRRRVVRHLRSNAIGYTALFLALTLAPAWAATIGKGDVKSKHIAKGAVKSKQLNNNAVKSKHVKDGALTADDLDDATLSGLQGEQGPPGEDGEDGADGATDVVVRTNSITVGAGFVGSTRVDCEAGETVTGGGAGPSGITRSNPTGDGGNTPADDGDPATGWIATRDNSGGATPQPLDVYALCASP